ncbi:ankyrin repeat-containing domain protein [Penicillium malachiteum]|nr:ankyrin repeat-containing domain protein [Penicillium malachiteum]
MVELLIKAKANIEAKLDETGRALLFMAAKQGSAPFVYILLRAGADAGAKDYKGKTAIGVAASHAHHDIAQVSRHRTSDMDC